LVDFFGVTVLARGFVILPTKHEAYEVLGSALREGALREEAD
jgi:hypothetical protein